MQHLANTPSDTYLPEPKLHVVIIYILTALLLDFWILQDSWDFLRGY